MSEAFQSYSKGLVRGTASKLMCRRGRATWRVLCCAMVPWWLLVVVVLLVVPLLFLLGGCSCEVEAMCIVEIFFWICVVVEFKVMVYARCN